ncbi:unnamed protein product [Cladocopium goreaui]|uniref:Nuclear transcription factor Y subunit n=1 Tax=Cladocopium goreaui TaxID=2562237 RepID=A0A9P1BTV0_9DINO|nr:unnamed protein product [Cladocopium goreaui]
MPPFWASQRPDESSAVLLDDYAVDPDQKSTSSKRPLFPAGEPERAKRPQNRNTLPAAVIKTDPRKEREFSNRHINDKRLGAKSRAEMLRQQILRGSQDDTVLRGTSAFQQRSAPGYTDMDDLQPEGVQSRPRQPAQLMKAAPEEDDASDSDGGSSDASQDASGQRRVAFGPLPENAPKRRRIALGGGHTPAASGGDVVVDFF